MKRRTLLRGLAGAVVFSVGGCTTRTDGDAGDGGSGDEPSASPSPSPTPSPTPQPTASPTPFRGTTSSPTESPGTATPPPTDAVTPSPTPTPATPDEMTGRSFSVVDSGCGEQRGGASVSWDHPDSTVTVTGTIWGNDTCYTAELAGASFEDDTLTVTVRATERAGTGETTACAQCIVQIDYEATVSFDHGLPSQVVVVHQHGDETERVVTEQF